MVFIVMDQSNRAWSCTMCLVWQWCYKWEKSEPMMYLWRDIKHIFSLEASPASSTSFYCEISNTSTITGKYEHFIQSRLIPTIPASLKGAHPHLSFRVSHSASMSYKPLVGKTGFESTTLCDNPKDILGFVSLRPVSIVTSKLISMCNFDGVPLESAFMIIWALMHDAILIPLGARQISTFWSAIVGKQMGVHLTWLLRRLYTKDPSQHIVLMHHTHPSCWLNAYFFLSWNYMAVSWFHSHVYISPAVLITTGSLLPLIPCTFQLLFVSGN